MSGARGCRIVAAAMTAPPDPLAEFRLDGDVAVVTGGASGIGRVVAAAFAAVGARVAIFDVAAAGGDAQ